MLQTIEVIYRDRLRVLIAWAGSQAALAKMTCKSPSQISQWLNASKDSKTGKPRAMERQSAREMERVLKLPGGWMDRPVQQGLLEAVASLPAPLRGDADALLRVTSDAEVASSSIDDERPPPSSTGMAHLMSHITPYNPPPELSWGEILNKNQELPDSFTLAMPDSSLAQTPIGTLLVFDRTVEPIAGWGVLVEDRLGYRHVRRYKHIRGDHWLAEATAPGFSSFDSIEDGLSILAVMVKKISDGIA